MGNRRVCRRRGEREAQEGPHCDWTHTERAGWHGGMHPLVKGIPERRSDPIRACAAAVLVSEGLNRFPRHGAPGSRRSLALSWETRHHRIVGFSWFTAPRLAPKTRTRVWGTNPPGKKRRSLVILPSHLSLSYLKKISRAAPVSTFRQAANYSA